MRTKFIKILVAAVLCVCMAIGVTAIFGCSSTTYTVKFETNGGSIVDDREVESGGTVERPATPSKDGYVFDGWFTDEGLTKEYDFGTAVTGNLTLYAKWKEVIIPAPVYYTVTFTDGETSVASETVESGNTVNEPATPAKDGFEFLGWFTKDGAVYDFGAKVESNLTLYAHWKDLTEIPDDPDDKPVTPPVDPDDPDDPDPDDPDPDDPDPDDPDPDDPEKVTHTVTFDYMGGEGQIAAAQVNGGESVAEPEEPVKNGYVLEGWYLSDGFEADKKYDFGSAVNEDITLYAHWVLNTEIRYTVTFDVDGGSPVSAQEHGFGEKAVRPQQPVKNGFIFIGWFSDEEKTQGYSFSAVLTSDITLYAKWQEIGATEPDEPAVPDNAQTTNYTYSVAALANKPADNGTLTQDNFTDGNSFLTVSGKVIYRSPDGSAKVECMVVTEGGLQVTFAGTGKITVGIASTGSSNISGFALVDKDGNYLEASTVANGVDRLTSNQLAGTKTNRTGTYLVTGTAEKKLTFDVTEAGTYTIYCIYYELKDGAEASRGTRILSLTMSDTVITDEQ